MRLILISSESEFYILYCYIYHISDTSLIYIWLRKMIVANDWVANDWIANDWIANDLVANDLVANDWIANDLVANDLVANDCCKWFILN